jgi:DnaK suppressor protein
MATKKKTQETLSKTAANKAKTKVVRKKAAKKVSKKITKKVATKVSKKVTKKASKRVAKKAAKKVAKRSVKKQPVKRRAANNPVNLPVDDSLIHGIRPYKQKAREKYMSAGQSKHFRNILLAWKTNLLDEVSKTIHLMQDENINHPDPNDRASQETDMSLELRNRDRERKLLKKIDSTVAMISSHDYGWCERCGVEIGIRRLEARPTADLCVDCKTLNEIKERQMV